MSIEEPLRLNVESSFHLSVVQHLIGHNPKLMLCKGSRGKTPLHTASQHGQAKIVKILIQSLQKQIETSDATIFEVTDENGNTSLHLAPEGENIAVVQLLVDNGASITATNSKGETPVHTAAQHKSVDIIKLFLDSGGNKMIELRDYHGSTPLHHAAENNQSEIITFLHER